MGSFQIRGKQLPITNEVRTAAEEALMAFCRDTLELSIDAHICRAIRGGWLGENRVAVQLGEYELETVQPKRTGDNVISVLCRSVVLAAPTKSLNEQIYQATDGKWFRECDIRASAKQS